MLYTTLPFPQYLPILQSTIPILQTRKKRKGEIQRRGTQTKIKNQANALYKLNTLTNLLFSVSAFKFPAKVLSMSGATE